MNDQLDINQAIAFLDRLVQNPEDGLPEEIFYFISRLTAMVNIDLLIRDENNRTLLSWRDTEFSGNGWHIPGGIIRFKESLESRIQKVARSEVGTAIEYNPNPIAITQIRKKHATRGHFISFLYKCFLSQDFVPDNKSLTENDPGFLMWHDSCPDNLVKVHNTIYRDYIEGIKVEYLNVNIPFQSFDF